MSKQEEEIPFEALTGEYTFDPALEAEGGPSEVDQYYHEEPTFWENLCNRYGKRALRALGVVVGIGALMGLVDGLDGKLDGRFDIFSNLNKSAEAAGVQGQPFCTDSDADAEHPLGDNPFLKGTINGIQGNAPAERTDQCLYGTLHEYSFVASGSCHFDWDKFHCEDLGLGWRCEEGA